MKLPSAETLREQIASDPDDEPTAGPVEAPEAALTSKERLTRLDHYGRTLDDLAIDGQWYFCLRSEVQPLLDRQRGEIESLKRELSAYQECEKLAAPLSCPLHGLVPNLASFDNKCPDCERDRLRAALNELQDETQAVLRGEHGEDWADHFGSLFNLIQRAKELVGSPVETTNDPAVILEELWRECRVVFYPELGDLRGDYPIEHAPFANKDARSLIEARLAERILHRARCPENG